ncbi:two-component system vancomycin resistance associated response regulator VraR [Paenibacillus endophyticus]|uniref:Two-component system vancomycin resistance associated response regulator VraR n=1 Tax=Paenibacillus endophyticus TaxID=1294268 RepID=A0A7W5C922_9BACL|nr:response regulator transcription factor [Paenibacillus endophyticus]MBB3153000.1 two-component system vancomycin resistance associated response regulator VraR [Paenibacillus endophyticus]
MNKIQVWIVEDDLDWLRGLVAYINKELDLEVVWTSSKPEDVRLALQNGLQQSTPADVVLMDIMLEGRPEGVLLAEEAALATGAKVIMLTSMEEKELIFRSFQAGAIDYQIKSDFEKLPEAIRSAYRSQSPINAAVAENMREEFRRLKQLEREFEVKKLGDLITPSELQLLDLIDQGYTQPQIADKLVVSIRTVKNHVNHILKKLNLSGSREAANKAKEMGLFHKKNDKDSTR